MTGSARYSSLACLAAALVTGACRDQASAATGDSASTPKSAVSDSQYTAAYMIAAFRKSVPQHPDKFGAGATTNRDSLLIKYAQALDTKDTAAFTAMRISVSEYAWLYYLEMPQSKPPYELDPDVLWMQLNSQSNKGLGRLTDRVSKSGFGLKSYDCDSVQQLGAVILHHCHMTGSDVTVPVTVIERDGLFKFTSYANQL